ncbi:hypothetical protein BU25DRAFT_453497 [Macroventuria anomochaeta]|uniref:Uncharacterized protein n=1 Tax=Macroventuria anomochaeta TaxID=301207 RepID=A0ACB6SK79_9PLEO|nr:uncharacterized protein BU25DRAFT_453497 [Macroventuria anomochaeta]KAF2633772.1 hypothetical protein BU25DRAFT_453497 [Macroventuria anomochaeta]
MNLDGASDSKPTVELDHKHTAIRKPEHKPTKLRRFMSIGSRGSKVPSKPDINTKPGNTPPLQTLSPRPTEHEPQAKKQTKRSISTFLLSKNSSANEPEPANDRDHFTTAQDYLPVTETSLSSSPPATKGGEGSLEGQRHLPVTGNPYQSVEMQPRKDSATKSFCDMPAAASRTAALTSHPVGKEDLESEEEFQTPPEF